jgi:lycopene cyclase domain-containing protein
MGLLYLVALALALAAMVALDFRFRLFFFRDARRASVVLIAGVLFFVAWDFAGIGLGIFFRGETVFLSGIQLVPEFPLEELFFLTLLCYVAMILFGFLTRSTTHPLPPKTTEILPDAPLPARPQRRVGEEVRRFEDEGPRREGE